MLVQIVFVIGIMLWTSWKLTMVSFTMVPVAALIAHIYGRFYRNIMKETQTSLADASGVADEALASMSTVKSMAGEDLVAAGYDNKLKRYLHLQTKESAAYSLYASLTIFCPNAAMLATLAYGGETRPRHPSPLAQPFQPQTDVSSSSLPRLAR